MVAPLANSNGSLPQFSDREQPTSDARMGVFRLPGEGCKERMQRSNPQNFLIPPFSSKGLLGFQGTSPEP